MELKVFTSAISGIRSAAEVITSIIRVTIDFETKSKLSGLLTMLIDMQGKLIEAQAATAAIQRRLIDLEDEKKNADQFRAEKARYRAVEKGPGAFVYALKELYPGDEPAPDLCAACFDQDIKSILQLTKHTPGGRIFGCSRCKAEIVLPIESAGVTIETIRRRRSIFDDY